MIHSIMVLQNLWAAFIQAVEVLAERHPYVVKPSAGQVGRWGMCFAIASVIGCASINPDGGSYPQVGFLHPISYVYDVTTCR